MGIVSSIGNNKIEVLDSLKNSKSGIQHSPEYAELEFRSHVHGSIDIDLNALIDRKQKRFMGDSAAYCYVAMQEAIDDANLNETEISNERTGLIVGQGGSSNENMLDVIDTLRSRGARKVGPTMVPRIMTSSNSACLSVAYKIKGVNYSISSACATSAHCIGNAYEIIQSNKQDLIFAGGGEEIHWTSTLLFDSMGALSSKYNDNPEQASRPYDSERDGFVISGGGSILVVEELQHALARNAKIYAEIIGYGATSDGFDMVKPSGEGAVRCMQQALGSVDAPIDYINAHATSTPAGDITELDAIRKVFKKKIPVISATKSQTGHGLGAAGSNESIYSLLMLENNFIAKSMNISKIDSEAKDMPIASNRIDDAELKTIMSNSFGFGGTNACIIFQKYPLN
ncbi:MAG: beta-ketoacyl-[acyl-carrier-protein] synthase I [Legionellales bacterium]|jgi:3-oxoacyl-[acyl-carrier-protein] synthase-1|nr:beta-ketoacyl-[acyl-carrier-protein] synthase I [Legionellales bacterium]|tara:strand:+ start:3308 stop:4504 length:1197 start_codon:yes stop_codon:yes gene_type:complete